MKALFEQDPAPFVEESERALESRLRAAAEVLLPASCDIDGVAARGTGVLADTLARQVQSTARVDELWLLLTAVAASFPAAELLARVRRELSLAEPSLALITLLDGISRSGVWLRSMASSIRIVQDSPVVDVDFCATNEHNTGIQRVVRETVALWNAEHPLVLARWNDGDDAFCALSGVESDRVLEWNTRSAGPSGDSSVRGLEAAAPVLIVPFRTTVILPEAARESVSARLAALAEFSGNRVVMIGYDAIPFVSADLLPDTETEKFARYSTIVKHASRVAAISVSAAEEFRGYTDAARAQGLSGPQVSAVLLPAQPPGAVSAPSASGSLSASRSGSAQAGTPGSGRLVLIVGNQEPRKNLLAVLFAAETLWRSGLRFRLRMIGGARPDYKRLVDREVTRLRRAGFAVELMRGVGDDVLADSYRSAWFTIFPSIHEGYGLPVAESLALGVPSITSNFGSTLEIASGGGCLTVDPRDDADITATMRRLLTDDALHDSLVAEALARSPRTWQDYASELWRDLMEPLEAGTHV
ncbi:glycosyltransferase [Subtercola sp. PAMC28395]|uniref:glycosyltransferase n=1 Tax=Subtercola sp. PAMC28395 TaxID=2846775 RepID=UPI001C0E34A4|nr:glycosyltransferase [Subtercola sp. PAMC28395]QWT25038.1 glycosyltransferase [Subtercola sp. PAMC28395]